MHLSILFRCLKSLFLIFLLPFVVSFVATGTFQNAFGAEEFPTREIRLFLPFGPGGTIDMGTRLFADKVSKILGVPVVVVNNTAGGGTVASLTVSQAKPDGYTLLGTVAGQLILKPMLNPEISLRYTDFTPISRIYGIPFGLWVRNEAPWRNLKELIEHAKKNPGTLRATAGPPASDLNVLLQIFKAEAGIDIALIPTSGGTGQSAALLGGHSQFNVDAVPTGIPFLKAGRLRALASTHKIREFPAIRTFAEEGLPRVNVDSWQGIYGPKELPKAIVTKLTKAFEKAASDPSLLEQMGKMYIEPSYQDPDVMSKALDSWKVNIYDSLKQVGLIK